ncbi:MAG: fibronectin/fibrinogen-binding protein [Clostridiales bacterium]|nr:fibronectin/fibrinogen-binding protein [Clostridiales bacterium]
MIYDGIITRSVINELNSVLIGGKVEKLSMPSKNEIYIHIYNNQKYILNINLNANEARINLTSKVKTLPLSPSMFCMVIRKHLQNYRINSIKQYLFDRIIFIEFEGYNEMNDKETKYLIIELMGKHSNCILVNNNMKIIDSLKHVDDSVSSVRTVLPGLEYDYPKTKVSIENTSLDEFDKLIQNYIEKEDNISRFLISTFNGFSNFFCFELLKICNISKDVQIKDLSKDNIKIIYNEINNIIQKIDSNKIDIKNEDNKNMYLDFTVSYTNDFSINKYIDEYYISFEQNKQINELKQNLTRNVSTYISKLNKNLKIVNKNLKECEKLEDYRIYGELINSNLYRFSNNERYENISVENYYNNNNLITIPIDNTCSLSLNAQKYFKKYNKLKTTYTYSISQKELIENELNYLESVLFNTEASNNIDELSIIKQELINQKYIKIQKKKETSKNNIKSEPIKYTYEGYDIYVGKNNIQNDYLTHKFANNNDMWLHTQGIHGSHVIIKNSNNNNIPDKIIEFASNLSAYYSKGQTSSKVMVDYCLIKYVKKHPFNKPGMVIYTDYKSIYTTPDKHEEYIIK